MTVVKRLSPASFLLPILLVVCCPASSPAADGKVSRPPPETHAYRSATACAPCHPEIYRSWKSSRHATSFTDPVFQLPYDRIRRSHPGKAAICEQCHNPGRFLLPPNAPLAAIFAQEGVTCDFCHSVESVRLEGPFPRYHASPGVMRGPRGGEPGKLAHATMFSGLHITSEFCGGCHEYRNEFGVSILGTYSEWAESFYRGEGVHCQFCHLPQIFDAKFIASRRKKGPLDHSMSEGHKRERLAKAVPMRAALKVSGNDAKLTVTLKNETVGHKTPSGIPTSRLRLVSTLYDAEGKVLGRKEEVFEKVVGDGAGKALEKPELIFTAAREVLKDNRLGPKETRKIEQVFPLDGAKAAKAEVALLYEEPLTDIALRMRSIDLPVSSLIVPAKAGNSALRAALIAIAAILLFLAAIVYVRRKGRKAG